MMHASEIRKIADAVNHRKDKQKDILQLIEEGKYQEATAKLEAYEPDMLDHAKDKFQDYLQDLAWKTSTQENLEKLMQP